MIKAEIKWTAAKQNAANKTLNLASGVAVIREKAVDIIAVRRQIKVTQIETVSFISLFQRSAQLGRGAALRVLS
jgi:hypothetical protein